MRHIRHVIIENFQSHARTELTFGPGLNVIVGPSDNGKTAILRALRWALWGEPDGTEFVRRGARECRVQVTLSDGTTIRRERGPRLNRYVVQVPGAEPLVLEGFGRRVPAEVLRAHGMAPVALDTDRQVLLHLAGQLEGPFLLAEPASVRARAIGRLLGVHVLDAAARLCRRDLQAVQRAEREAAQEVEQVDGELAAYTDLPQWEQAVARAEAALAAARERQARLERLRAIAAQLQEVEGQLAATRALLGRLGYLHLAEQRLAAATQAAARLRDLRRLQQDLAQVQAAQERTARELAATAHVAAAAGRLDQAAAAWGRLARLRELCAAWQDVSDRLDRGRRYLAGLAQVPVAAQRLDRARDLSARLGRLRPLLDAWRTLVTDQERAAGALAAARRDLAALAQQYRILLAQAGRCPTCWSPVTPAVLAQITAAIAPGEES